MNKVVPTLIGVISIVTLLVTLVTKSRDPLSTATLKAVGLHGVGVYGHIGSGCTAKLLDRPRFSLCFGPHHSLRQQRGRTLSSPPDIM